MKAERELFYTSERRAWRAWLRAHHATAAEIWLVYFRKDSGKPRLAYNDAVEEALCFGWIDSVLMKVDAERFAQRFSPRKPNSKLSPMNRERVKRLIAARKMTKAGLEKVSHLLEAPPLAPDVLEALRRDPQTWRNFQAFPASYQRIRVGWVDGARKRPAEFKKRLRYLLAKTAKNERFGMVQ